MNLARKSISRKIILVGFFGVGKTSLIRRFIQSKFSEEYLTTIGVKIDKKLVALNDYEVNMIIWDIAGEVSPSRINSSYYQGAHAAIVVCDLTRPSTYNNLKEDIQILQKKNPSIPIIAVGNKKDLLEEDKLEALLKQIPFPLDFVSSAKTGENVEEFFKAVAEKSIHGHL